MATVTRTQIGRGGVSINFFGIGLGLQVTGVRRALGLLRKGAHKVAAVTEKKLATK